MAAPAAVCFVVYPGDCVTHAQYVCACVCVCVCVCCVTCRLLNTSWSSQPVVVLTSGMMVDATKGQLDVAFTFPNPVFSLSAPLFLLASLLLAVVTYRVVSRKLA